MPNANNFILKNYSLFEKIHNWEIDHQALLQFRLESIRLGLSIFRFLRILKFCF